MKITQNFDPEEMLVMINIESNLFTKYYKNFVGLVKQTPNLPEGTKVTRTGANSAMLSFSPGKNAPIKTVDDNTKSIGIDFEKMKSIQDAVNNFTNSAIRYLLKTTEFIPLVGYGIKKLQADLKGAIDNKRNFCVISTYKEFKDMETKGEYKFHQYLLEYGSSEWADVASLIYDGNIKELKKIYTPKLTFVEWI